MGRSDWAVRKKKRFRVLAVVGGSIPLDPDNAPRSAGRLYSMIAELEGELPKRKETHDHGPEA